MADEPNTSGWLPPRAPGAAPAPQYETAPPEPEPVPEPEQPATMQSYAPPMQQHQTPAPQQRPVYAKPATQGNGLALTALVLGIIGITVLVISLGLAFIFTLPCSIAAWICAAQARARIAVGETTAGRGQAQAAYILGILGVVLGIVAMVGWVIAIASGLDLDQLREDIERQSNPDAVEAVRAAVASVLGR